MPGGRFPCRRVTAGFRAAVSRPVSVPPCHGRFPCRRVTARFRAAVSRPPGSWDRPTRERSRYPELGVPADRWPADRKGPACLHMNVFTPGYQRDEAGDTVGPDMAGCHIGEPFQSVPGQRTSHVLPALPASPGSPAGDRVTPGSAPEEPVHAVPVGEVAVTSERHVPQVVEQRCVATDGQLVEGRLEGTRSPLLPGGRRRCCPGCGTRVGCSQSVAENSTRVGSSGGRRPPGAAVDGAAPVPIGVSRSLVTVSSPPRHDW